MTAFIICFGDQPAPLWLLDRAPLSSRELLRPAPPLVYLQYLPMPPEPKYPKPQPRLNPQKNAITKLGPAEPLKGIYPRARKSKKSLSIQGS